VLNAPTGLKIVFENAPLWEGQLPIKAGKENNMSRHEQRSIGELWITKGIRAGKRKLLAKMLKFYAVVPAAIVANRYFTGAMANGLYAILNSGLPGDGLAHNITVAATTDTGADTPGSILFTGLDIEGKIITENIIPAQGSTVQGVKAFAKVTSMLQSGWVLVGGNDTIVIGFGEVLGLPDYIAAAADVLMAAFTTGLINTPTVVVGAQLCNNTIVVPTGDGSKVLRVLYQV